MKTNFKLILCLFFLFSIHIKAQNIGVFNGENFSFKNGDENWSEPIKVNLTSKDGVATPVSVRIKFKKRVMLACHYYVEITNLSETNTVKFEIGNRYTDAQGNEVTDKFKLAPKAMDEGKLIYAEGLKKPKSTQDCLNCTWSMHFYEIKIK
jgi:hypothetical protein